MRSTRAAIAAITSYFTLAVFGCGETPPSIMIECSGTPQADGISVNCAGDHNEGDINGDNHQEYTYGQGGAGGVDGGSGGGGGAEPKEVYYFCYAWGPYPASGEKCESDDNCPVALSPCEIPICVAGKCSVSWQQEGVSCGGDGALTCLGSYCCGEDDDPH